MSVESRRNIWIRRGGCTSRSQRWHSRSQNKPMSSRPNAALPSYSGLLTDLYELAMGAAYVQTNFAARATLELFVRHLPPHRNYLVAAGVAQTPDFLGNVPFAPPERAYLHSRPPPSLPRHEIFAS